MKNFIIFVCCIILFAACNLHKDNENDYDNVPALPLEKGKYQIFVFNENTGKHLFTIDHKGHGHNEYQVFRDFHILPQEKLIMGIDDSHSKIFFYNIKNGKYVKSIDLKFGTPTIRKMAGMYFQHILFGLDKTSKNCKRGQNWIQPSTSIIQN